jgi:hydrogenase maturation protease
MSAMADLVTPPVIAVIGCGNRNRSDDGAGSAVIAALRGAPLPLPSADTEVRLFDAGTDGMAVLYAARGCARLIIVDACVSGAAAGSLFEVPAEVVAAPHQRSYSLHDFRWDHALYAGRAMYGAAFPAEVVVLLIEASSVALGFELSAPVAAAVPSAVARIAALIAAPWEAAPPAADSEAADSEAATEVMRS